MKYNQRNYKGAQPLKKPRLSTLEDLCLLDSCRCLDQSMIIQGLSYCHRCRTFFYVPISGTVTKHYSITSALTALFKLSGDSSFFFGSTCVGLVANLCGNRASSGKLRILQSLSDEDAAYQRNCLRNEDWPNIERALNNYAVNNSFNLHDTIEVFKAISSALGKRIPTDKETDIQFGPRNVNSLIASFEVSPTDVEPNGSVVVKWNVKALQKCECKLWMNDSSWNVSFIDSKKITITEDTAFSLSVIYDKKQIESKTLTVTLQHAAEIESFLTNVPSPVMEGVKVQLCWRVTNATKITLVRKTNDYNPATMDVTHRMGIFNFIAQKTEIFELAASNRYGSDYQSLVVDVIAIPKFDISLIPQLTQLSALPEIRLLKVFRKSRFEDLSEKLNHILLPYDSNGLYLPLSKSIRSAVSLCDRVLNSMFNKNQSL